MNADKRMSSVLGPVIVRYLGLKRALGRGYDNEARILQSLDAFLTAVEQGPADLTPDTFASWCRSLERFASGVRRNWMRIARNLCLYRQRTEPGCFVPDVALFPSRHQTVRPYIFSELEITRLLDITHSLQRTRQMPVRPETFHLGIVLLYTTGLRRSELVRLTVGDYNEDERTLMIRETKFHKSRFVPIAADVAQEVRDYLQVRNRHSLPAFSDAPLLWNGQRGFRGYTGAGFAHKLHDLLKASGIRKHNGRPPRIHDFRWTFAVHALLRWYQSGVDVQAKLPLLATYMGHVSITSTHYYLPLVESLSRAATDLFAKQYGKLIKPLGTRKGGQP